MSNQKLSPSITLRFLAAPTDVLTAGSPGVHGGRVLEWIDKAACACAAGWSGTYCVTAYVGHIHFTRPISLGAHGGGTLAHCVHGAVHYAHRQ